MTKRVLLLIAFASLVAHGAQAGGNLADAVNRKVLRVCATPSNLPYSNEKGEGFENKIAELMAEELKLPKVEYTWFPQGLGFVRMTLAAKRCDLIMGTIQADELTLNTNHYYRTTYALLVKPGSELENVTSIFDPALKGKKIGVQAGAPAADHVAKAGLMADAHSYRFMVDTRYENPPQEMADDVRKGVTDAAVMWGPLAGWYANHGGEKLKVVPLLEERPNTEKLIYRITMGVRQGETNWKHEINNVIAKRQGDIDAILLDYGVPLIGEDNKPITAPRRGTN